MSTLTHTLEFYRRKEQEVFPQIPGMKELLSHYNTATTDIAKKYPDAAFALMTASEFMTGDRERNAINQEAYFGILGGGNIGEVRRRYQKAMDAYMKDHRWDD